MTRTRNAYEKYEKDEGLFYLISLCPFCKKENKILNGEVVKKCSHFAGERHGCGGTIFVFEE